MAIDVGRGPVLFQARNTTGQVISSAGSVVITLDAEDVDDANAHSTSVNPSRFVAPRAGKYRTGANVMFSASAATTAGTTLRGLQVTKNGTSNSFPATVVWAFYAGNLLPLATPVMDVDLVAGDYIEAQAYSALGSSTAQINATYHSMLRVELIR